MTDPHRAARVWLVMALATLWVSVPAVLPKPRCLPPRATTCRRRTSLGARPQGNQHPAP